MKKISKVLILALCITMFTGMGLTFSTAAASAEASTNAVKFLKGTWDSIGRGGSGAAMFYVKFTKTSAKYYVNYGGTLTLNNTATIVSTKKIKHGYLIKLKDKNGNKYSYRSKSKNELSCYMSWTRKNYNEDESLERP